MNWSVNNIRTAFLEYFESKGHKIEASAPMVIKNDPTLMFTNAGMNQFKDVFLGNSLHSSARVANSQKCLRVSGKHNDLEEVGVDTYHHTMFEMLGNWSFGDYFKKEAITWAWELLTEVYQLDKDRLYITVFEGDAIDGTDPDTESEEIWKKFVDPQRILRCNKKDNFWEMGEMGPCGPSSEIHIDLRSEQNREEINGRELVNKDHPQVVEIWNLVFIQFNRDSKGKLSNLPKKHVDTGMGLERLAMALQAKNSNYDTDVFTPLISKLSNLAKLDYKATDTKEDIAFRVASDHVRAVAFSIADGQLPSNNGAGYVIRRILRRAVRYGYSFLGLDKPFLFELVPVLLKEMGAQFPELKAQESLIASVIREEEESFLRTLSKGIVKLEKELATNKELSGVVAFELYDTFGFPIDLTQLIAAENDIQVDMEAFHIQLEKQKNRSRQSNELKTDDWVNIVPDFTQAFVGYDYLRSTSKICKYRKIDKKGKALYQLVLDVVPFYPEGGGQVGDTGLIIQDKKQIKVTDTKKENETIIVSVDSIDLNFEDSIECVVDKKARKLVQANHTATHLLHHALRNVLGKHVEQKGSLVSPKYLRFDFSHFQKVTSEELEKIENEVNDLIESALPLKENRSATIEEANEAGAMMLFGEKYGEHVRMIGFGDSLELCGGTHVKNTSQIRVFKLVSESSVAAGVRRVEAISSEVALNYFSSQEKILEEVKEMLNHTKQPIKKISELLKENENLNQSLEEIERQKANELKQTILNTLTPVGDLKYAFVLTTVKSAFVKDILFQLKAECDSIVIGVASIESPKIIFSLLVSESLAEEKGIKANEGIKRISPIIQGGGGGQAFYATAGGKNLDGFNDSKQSLIEWIKG